MKIAYFDCFAGASGDMILGSLMDAGLDVDRLRQEVGKLQLTHYDLGAQKVTRKGMGGTQAVVTVDEDHHRHHHHHLHHIKEIIAGSDLEEQVKQQGIEIFTRLARAEAMVHRTSIEQVHFHEVGAMDAIIDVMGAVGGLAALGIEEVYCSPLHVGTGTVQCAHGTLPVPAPATMELTKGKPIYSTGVAGELLTPTGAAILTTLASGFGPMPAMTVEGIGYGAGTSDHAIPNLLRVIIGEDHLECYHAERVAVVEATVGEMDPERTEQLTERILALGALDVFLAPVHLKGGPGSLLTVTCTPEMLGKLSELLLGQTAASRLRWRMDNGIRASGRAEQD
jgi:uncharacterized protein (TIGR00299 family) protein